MTPPLARDRLHLLYRNMVRIRIVESEISQRYADQEMRCPVHLSIGQEAPAAAFGLAVTKEDRTVSSHRGHAHYLGKGGDLPSMIAELYGRATGCSGGFGGSMHLVDQSVGFMGTSAIVGNSIPVGVGLALAAQMAGRDALVGVFLGDGATEEGVFYESVNIAALRRLPVLFLCENNGYSVYTGIEERWPEGRDITNIVRAMGVRAQAVDGQSAAECLDTIDREVARIRSGEGPAFLEFRTYRYLEHCGPAEDDHLGYRPTAEVERWRHRDPITLLRNELGINPKDDATLRDEFEREVATAFDRAREAPLPDPNLPARLIHV